MTHGVSVIKTASGEPVVDQQVLYGWTITWNPDDEMFHAERGDGTSAARFRSLRNMVQYARTHRRDALAQR